MAGSDTVGLFNCGVPKFYLHSKKYLTRFRYLARKHAWPPTHQTLLYVMVRKGMFDSIVQAGNYVSLAF